MSGHLIYWSVPYFGWNALKASENARVFDIKSAVRLARQANRRAVMHGLVNGRDDAAGVLYRTAERERRDALLAWARRWKTASSMAYKMGDARLASATKKALRTKGPELDAYRAEAIRRAAIAVATNPQTGEG